MKTRQILRAAALTGALICSTGAAFAQEQSENPTFAIEVSNVTTNDFQFTITPSSETATYYYYATPKSKFESEGGKDGIVSFDVSFWQAIADLYGAQLSEVITANSYTGAVTVDYQTEYGKKAYWDSEYVIYCYGILADGTVTSEIYTQSVTTLTPTQSDNTFDVQITSIDESDSKYYVVVNATVTPSNDDPYYCVVHNKATYDWYFEDENALTPENPEIDYISTEIINAGYETYTGPISVNCRIRKSREYYVVVVGISDEGPTTEVNLTEFTAEVTTGVNDIAADKVVARGGKGEIALTGDFDRATIYSLDGKMVNVTREATQFAVNPGCYIVKFNVNGKTQTAKILVK